MTEPSNVPERPSLEALLGAVTAFVVAWVTLGLRVGVSILLIFTVVVFRNELKTRFREVKPWRAFRERWQGADLKNYGFFRRCGTVLYGAVYRTVATLHYRRNFWICVFAFLMGCAFYLGLIVLSNFGFIFLPQDPAKKTYVVLTAFSISIVVTVLSYIWFREIARRLRRVDPHYKTVNEFVFAIKRYTDKHGSAEKIRRDIAIRDPGPIIVLSIAARDLLTYDKITNALVSDIYSEAWQSSPEKSFLVVLADPTCEDILQRNNRLNRRYLECYAIPYLRLMLKCQMEKQGGTPQRRLRLFKWKGEPDYRVVASRNRMIIQRYGRATHGTNDIPIVLHRVNFSATLEEKLSHHCGGLGMDRPDPGALVGGETQHRGSVGHSSGEYNFQSCALTNSDIWNRQEKILAKESLSIFSYFLDSFSQALDPTMEEKFLTDWDYEKLRGFAKCCGVPDKAIHGLRNSAALAEEICKVVGLQESYRKIA